MASEGETPAEETAVLSKNALKRQLKRQRWEDSKDDRRAYKKAKLKEKKEASKATGDKKPARRKPIEGQESSGIRVVIDCAFDELMTEKVDPYSLRLLMEGNQ
jgi:tRNA (guanine9-N1)-methyltransferase